MASSAFAALNALGWALRLGKDRPRTLRDLKWLSVYTLWILRTPFLQLFTKDHDRIWRHSFPLRPSMLVVYGMMAFCCCLVIYCLSITAYRAQGRGKDSPPAVERSFSHPCEASQQKPMVYPSRVYHVRTFPKKHSFSYSYLMVGVPVGWRGSVGTFLGADLKHIPELAKPSASPWLEVRSADHLLRGDDKDGLRGKVNSYLRSIGQDPGSYAQIYLITAPTMLGYSFNPASFWYLYGEDGVLKAMIVEVNNTFDERRMYFVENDSEEGEGGQLKFSSAWQKDFHVSPFNSRKGSYSMSAEDPWAPSNERQHFKNTINLYSSKNHLKLVASVGTVDSGIDPTSYTSLGAIWFLSSWFWVGLVTFPRILKEAFKLFFKRKLHVWYRPEGLENTIGRQATDDESAIEALFADFLRYRVEHALLAFPVSYTPCINGGPVDKIFRTETSAPSVAGGITLKPATPAFYAKLARSTDVQDAFKLDSDILQRLLNTSHQDELLQLFEHDKSTDIPPFRDPLLGLPFRARLGWRLVKTLRFRTRSPKSAHPSIRGFSDLDLYAIQHGECDKTVAYRKATLRLLLSDVLTFGIPELMDMLVGTLYLLLCIFQARSLFFIFFKETTTAHETVWQILGLFGLHLLWLSEQAI